MFNIDNLIDILRFRKNEAAKVQNNEKPYNGKFGFFLKGEKTEFLRVVFDEIIQP